MSNAPDSPPQEPRPPTIRLQALDAYRGLIMVALAFNGFGLAGTARNHLKATPDSGFWQAVHHQFEHVEWAGGGFWDLIQPSFMFMVGVSMAYSYVNRQREGQSWGRMLGHASWRAVVLIALGVFLSSNSARSTNWSCRIVLRTATPAAIARGFPPNVEACVPGPMTSAIEARVTQAPTGTPPARPFASVMMSGVIPSCS
mgnify:CR=1 FL=1